MYKVFNFSPTLSQPYDTRLGQISFLGKKRSPDIFKAAIFFKSSKNWFGFSAVGSTKPGTMVSGLLLFMGPSPFFSIWFSSKDSWKIITLRQPASSKTSQLLFAVPANQMAWKLPHSIHDNHGQARLLSSRRS